MWGSLTGFAEPVGGLIGYLAVHEQDPLSFAIVFGIVSGMMVSEAACISHPLLLARQFIGLAGLMAGQCLAMVWHCFGLVRGRLLSAASAVLLATVACSSRLWAAHTCLHDGARLQHRAHCVASSLPVLPF